MYLIGKFQTGLLSCLNCLDLLFPFCFLSKPPPASSFPLCSNQCHFCCHQCLLCSVPEGTCSLARCLKLYMRVFPFFSKVPLTLLHYKTIPYHSVLTSCHIYYLTTLQIISLKNKQTKKAELLNTASLPSL